MPLDPSYAGRTYPPTPPYRVGREKIRQFARAIGAADGAYVDPEAAKALGYDDVVAPPTFPVVLATAANEQVVNDPALGVDYSRVVHGDQRFRYARPVVAGDELVCVTTVEEVFAKAGHDFLTTRHDVITTAGEPVVSVWCKLVIRGVEEG
jgi:acyl dehydratase